MAILGISQELRVSDRQNDNMTADMEELPQVDPGETASLSVDLSDIDPDEEAVFSDEVNAEEFEDEEVLPLEFLEDPETFSSVFPRGDLDDERFNNETVIMSPSEVRRLANRNVSSRRAPGAASGAGSRRSRNDEENLSPEALALRRHHDRVAKILLYGIIAFVTLAFLALVTYKLPKFFPDTFPNGLWPWNWIFSGDSYE